MPNDARPKGCGASRLVPLPLENGARAPTSPGQALDIPPRKPPCHGGTTSLAPVRRRPGPFFVTTFHKHREFRARVLRPSSSCDRGTKPSSDCRLNWKQNRRCSARAKRRDNNMGDGAEPRQGIRSIRPRQYPSHPRRTRRSRCCGSRGRIHPRR